MPPPPALRCSPGREPKFESKHKRVHSLESGLSFKAKDDDLILFNEMQMKESDNFLLHSSEDLDDSLSKLKCSSDFKLGVKIPVHGESSNLLNSDDEKNDYDWLLTPPDTPLFPSLDDEEPPPSNLVAWCRQSQPISISKSSKLPFQAERNQRPNRTSASPRGCSPSLQHGVLTLQSSRRAASVPGSSPAPTIQSTTPSKRPCTPPMKPSSPNPRSITPTLRRSSSGLTSSSPRRRGTSPIKGIHGSYASPKLRGWQLNTSGLSSDAPPNLQTSVSDGTALSSRGSSPASTNARESPSIHNRQSMSPRTSRSVSSSHSHDCDHVSLCSKGSIVSSGDDDVVSCQSLNVGNHVSRTGNKSGMFVNNRAMAFHKKASRIPLSSSAPKRSIDSALRQMDQRKAPQNMFRPLMSSVPSSSFYGGKANILHRPIFSGNSSLTTSSNASSEQGASVAPETDYSEHDHADLTSEWEKTPKYNLQEEIFILDKMDGVKEDARDECHTMPFSIDDGTDGGKQKMPESENKDFSCDIGSAIPSVSLDSPCIAPFNVLSASCQRTATCSICGKSFQSAEVSGNADVCLDCVVNNDIFSVVSNNGTQFNCQEEDNQNKMTDLVGSLYDKSQSNLDVSEFPEETGLNADLPFQHMSKSEPTVISQEDCGVQLAMATKEENNGKQSDLLWTIDSIGSISDFKFQRSESFAPSSNIDSDEGTGISVLLRRSNGSNEHVLQGRMFTASHIQCAEPSYARGNLSSTRLSNSHNSSSALSSVDFGSSKGSVIQGRIFTPSNAQCSETSYTRENMSSNKLSHSWNSCTDSSSLDLGSPKKMEEHFQRQLSVRQGTTDCLESDLSLDIQNSLDSPICHTSLEVLGQSHESKGCSDVADFCDYGDASGCKTMEFIDSSDVSSLSTETVGSRGNGYTKSYNTMSVPFSESSGFSQSSHVVDSSLVDAQISGSSNTHGHPEIQTKERNVTDMEGPIDATNTGKESESGVIDSRAYITSSEMLVHDAHEEMENSQLDRENSQNSSPDKEASSLPSVVVMNDEVQSGSQPEPELDNHAENIQGMLEHDTPEKMENSLLDCENSQDSSTNKDASSLPSVVVINDEVHSASQPEPKLDNHTENIQENSSVTVVESPRGQKLRSLTLEEATDTILFCSSIIHDLAYKAATIGIENEQSSMPDPEVSRSTVAILEKPVSYQNGQSIKLTRRTKKSQKVRKKKVEKADALANEAGSDAKVEELYTTVLPHKSESTRPPKMESKCNCTVM